MTRVIISPSHTKNYTNLNGCSRRDTIRINSQESFCSIRTSSRIRVLPFLQSLISENLLAGAWQSNMEDYFKEMHGLLRSALSHDQAIRKRAENELLELQKNQLGALIFSLCVEIDQKQTPYGSRALALVIIKNSIDPDSWGSIPVVIRSQLIEFMYNTLSLYDVRQISAEILGKIGVYEISTGRGDHVLKKLTGHIIEVDAVGEVNSFPTASDVQLEGKLRAIEFVFKNLQADEKPKLEITDIVLFFIECMGLENPRITVAALRAFNSAIPFAHDIMTQPVEIDFILTSLIEVTDQGKYGAEVRANALKCLSKLYVHYSECFEAKSTKKRLKEVSFAALRDIKNPEVSLKGLKLCTNFLKGEIKSSPYW